MGPRREYGDLRVRGGIPLHVDVRKLDSPGLGIAARAKVQPQHHFELLEGRHFLQEAPRAQLDQLFGALRHRREAYPSEGGGQGPARRLPRASSLPTYTVANSALGSE